MTKLGLEYSLVRFTRLKVWYEDFKKLYTSHWTQKVIIGAKGQNIYSSNPVLYSYQTYLLCLTFLLSYFIITLQKKDNSRYLPVFIKKTHQAKQVMTLCSYYFFKVKDQGIFWKINWLNKLIDMFYIEGVFSIIDFSKEQWSRERGITAAVYPSYYISELLQTVDLTNYFKTSQCSRTAAPYDSPTDGWKNGTI